MNGELRPKWLRYWHTAQALAIFGLLAAREPGAHWIWRVIYLALGALCVYGLLPRRARHRG